MYKAAKVVSLEEIKDYFAIGQPTTDWQFDSMGGLSYKFVDMKGGVVVKILLRSVEYHVKGEAVDDPTDYIDVVTRNPVKELSKFMSGGHEELEEFFKKMSCDPSQFASLIRRIAAWIGSGSATKEDTVKILRRVQLLHRSGKRTAKEGYVEKEVDEILKKLFDKMKDKGWDPEVVNDDGLTEIKIDMNGLYDISIKVDSISWNYQFVDSQGKESGTTDDPVRAYQDWMDKKKEERKSNDSTWLRDTSLL